MAKKEYTVAKFCEQYSKSENAKVKELLMKDIVINDYIDFQKKITICELIIKSSHFNKINIGGVEQEKLHVNSPSKYMLYCLNLVNHYTNIKIDFRDSLNEFNMLNKCGMLDEINKYIPERELKEFKMILNMVESDVIQNEYEIHSFIGNQIDRILDVASAITQPSFNHLRELIEGVDANVLNDFITNIVKKY